ncbi:uncharacterized protein LOC131963006 [Centropristis striata]|uniref:uncharacterized protein LOC131963006 n=1 Tax=Centropristis striata TaxID=184440 RepID=UPI0027DFC6A0|nr:uncharacterized protein LOC131963006 [Centropristis striata]
MASAAVLCLVFLSAVFPKGLTAPIKTRQTVMAEGEEASFNWELMQVTWQKILPDGEKNPPTYGEYFGLRFQPKLKLKSPVIVIRAAMGEDEGLFNTYPEDALTWFIEDEMYGADFYVRYSDHVRASDSPEETVVSCWATGGPAPTVTLTVPHYNSSRVTNSNGTVTVTTTSNLSALHHESRQVGCVVRWSSGPHREVSTLIPADGLTWIIKCLLSSMIAYLMIIKAASKDINNSRKSRRHAGQVPAFTFRARCRQIGSVVHCGAKMAQREFLYLLCSLGLCQEGQSALIETQQTVLAAEGEEAQLNCQLMKEKDVQQVTWWKILPDGEKSLASSHEKKGQKVNPDFRDKMEFKYVGQLSCSIVIRNVTEEDEGCYRCLFNTYHEGDLNGTTCLRLYELHGPVLHVRASDSPEETVVSCWATGGPAPTVTLTVPHYNSSRVTNSNGTVTVTTTALLSALHHNTTQVNCTAHVSSGPHREVSTIIPAGKQSSDDGRTRIIKCLLFSIFVACCFAAAAKSFLCKQRNHNSLSHRETEMNEMMKLQSVTSISPQIL